MMEKKLISTLKAVGIDFFLSLPCEKIKKFVQLAGSEFNFVSLSREEEGVGIGAGLWLAGKKPVMVIQSSGIGNCVNALMSLNSFYKIPLPIFMSWRGVFAETIEAQKPFGKILPELLQVMGIHYIIFDGSNFEAVQETLNRCFRQEEVVAILLRPDVWEKSADLTLGREKITSKNIALSGEKALYTREEFLKGIVQFLRDKIIVSNIGFPSKELYSVLDQPSNFYMLGSMGMAGSIATGLALAGKEVIVIDGDGSILMNPSTLFTAMNAKVKGLTIMCLDNGAHGSTGNQPTAALNADLQLLAVAAGFNHTFRCSEPAELGELLKQGDTKFIHVVIKPGNAPVPGIPYSGVEIRNRFMEVIR